MGLLPEAIDSRVGLARSHQGGEGETGRDPNQHTEEH
jgi:hypothetical protein